MSAEQLDELLALLQVPGTAVAAGRLVVRRRVAASGWVVLEDGTPFDPWLGLHVSDPGYLNLALVPWSAPRAAPVRMGRLAERSPGGMGRGPDVDEPWRLAAGWARLGAEVVTTPEVSLPVTAR